MYSGGNDNQILCWVPSAEEEGREELIKTAVGLPFQVVILIILLIFRRTMKETLGVTKRLSKHIQDNLREGCTCIKKEGGKPQIKEGETMP